MTEQRIKEILQYVSALVIGEGIETERLRLRAYNKDDKADFLEFLSSPEVQRLTGMNFKTQAEYDEAFEKCLPTDNVPMRHFAIELKEERKVIGNIDFSIYPFIVTEEAFDDKKIVSLSFELNEKYQKRGIMTEMLNAVIDFLLIKHDFDFVNAGYFEFNEGSRKLQEKCGMKFWMTHVFPFEGQNINTREMLISREDRQAQKRQL